jgi:hypothetical protein
VAWPILGGVIESPVSRMEADSLVVSELWVAAVDFLPFFAPLVWDYSLVELECKMELPQKIPNRSSEQGNSTGSAEFNLSASMLYIPSSSQHYSPIRSDKTILPGPPPGKSSPSKYSSLGSSYC